MLSSLTVVRRAVYLDDDDVKAMKMVEDFANGVYVPEIDSTEDADKVMQRYRAILARAQRTESQAAPPQSSQAKPRARRAFTEQSAQPSDEEGTADAR